MDLAIHSDPAFPRPTRALVAFAALALTLHAIDSSPSKQPPNIPVGEATPAFTSAGVERVIPLRWVTLSNAVPPTPVVGLEAVQQAILRANTVYRAAGVQFTLKANDIFHVDALYDAELAPEKKLCWDAPSCPDETRALNCPSGGEIWKVAATVFPGVVQTTRPACDTQVQHEWLGDLALHYAPPDAIHVWVHAGYGGGFSDGPAGARYIFMGYAAGGAGFAHELGHYFGLTHVDWVVQGAWNAETAQTSTPSDFWDMIYFPGTSDDDHHKFFSHRTEVKPFETRKNTLGQGLQPMERDIGNTNDDWSCKPTTSNVAGGLAGRLSCEIGVTPKSYVEHLTSESAPISDKLGFVSNALDSPPTGSFQYGVNVMTYYNPIADDAPSSISESQAMMIRRSLRHGVEVTHLPPVAPSYRTRLGDSRRVSPLEKLDIDGDDRRDIAFYTPPLNAASAGKFQVFQSSSSWAQTPSVTMTFSLGKSGDSPVVGDFNGDGVTDFGVYQPGGATPTATGWGNESSRFVYCLTPKPNPLSTPCSDTSPSGSASFGQRDDILVGAYPMTRGKDALLLWRPSTGEWQWRSFGTGGSTDRKSMGVGEWFGSVPLPGLYDGDDRADLVVYRPSDATFHALLSTEGYAKEHVIEFPSIYVEDAAGSSVYGRSGAIPVGGMTWKNAKGQMRDALSLWQPGGFQWRTVYDPFGEANVLECSLGALGDRPLGGLGLSPARSLASSYAVSDLAVFRSGGTNDASPGDGLLLRKTIAPFRTDNHDVTCPSTVWTTTAGEASSRWPVFSVSDMTGDGIADVIELVPETQRLYLHSSQATPTYARTLTLNPRLSIDALFLLAAIRRRDPRDPAKAHQRRALQDLES